MEKHLKALSINEEVWGKNHKITQHNYKNIALLYYTMGRYKEAQKYARLAQQDTEIELEDIRVTE